MTRTMDVLVVEDEMLLAMDIEAMIEDSGHRVLAEAASLQDVQALPDDLNPQLAFVDLHLAHNSTGFEVCSYIRQHWPDTLIIFVTANVSKIPADFSGAHGVIAKPFSHAGVVNAIKYLADGAFDPPPSIPRPASLVASPHLKTRWG
ncbi:MULTISPECIES: response regulator [Sphingomonas]|jgi:CheY-like chemotaxis protein|uniref:Response regulator n=1 Tax=Sphingomonas glacialis TaxID=658225 RepID=A0ABQ3LCU4_9SPHN|nr:MULTISPECIES: response regulator [Sphingomonas]MDY7523196.1 response regulator [Sphingomonas sp. 10B4]MEB0282667.1 response regulator [Sphingomonas sp. 10B4]GHH12140.1 response regulator [Sphingomonas glacialis]